MARWRITGDSIGRAGTARRGHSAASDSRFECRSRTPTRPKTRPACVISVPAYNSGPDFVVAMVTSSARFLPQPGLGDVVISDWRAAGLQQRSVIRAGRLLVIERPLLVRSLGRLTPSDLTALGQALKAVLGLT
ncbi:MAG: type II toxin-antitoxin system PemK/MazF family toxin [Acidimicrobiales bacterium]